MICFPGSPLWSFFDYVVGEGNPIEDWYQELSEQGKFAFDFLLKNQQKIESHLNWTGFKFMKGKLKDEKIWQMDFIADKRQYRVLGVFGTIRRSAVLILGCYHKGDTYTPQDALETAYKRAKALREGRAQEHERKIKSDT